MVEADLLQLLETLLDPEGAQSCLRPAVPTLGHHAAHGLQWLPVLPARGQLRPHVVQADHLPHLVQGGVHPHQVLG